MGFYQQYMVKRGLEGRIPNGSRRKNSFGRKTQNSESSFVDLGRVGLIGTKRLVRMCRGCPDLQDGIGGVT